MRSVTIAQGRLQSSRLGFGTSSLHHLRNARERASLLGHCFDRGMRHFDSAPLYGHELAEQELGRFLRGRRPEIVVATKFGIEPNRWMRRSRAFMYMSLAARGLASRLGLPGMHDWVRDYSPQHMLRSLERSLINLRTDYVDLLFAHEPSLASRGFSDALVRELERIRADGKARFVGLAGNAGDCLAIAERYPQLVDVLQVDVSGAAEAVQRLTSAGLVAEVTFGHFRSAVKGTVIASRASIIRERLALAAAENPRGVILFSARTAARIDEVVGAIESIDRVAA